MKRILLFTATSGLLYLTLSSNSWGPASSGLNSTGSPGSAFGCNGCHSGGPGTTTAGVQIRKLSSGPNGPIVTQYMPDTNYIVKVVGNHSTLTHFGFQLTALKSGNVNAGTFSNLPANTQASIVSNETIVEHSDQLPKTNNQFESTFNWKAPASGSGTVTFYGMINAVDNNNQVGGDKPSPPFTIALTETTPASVGNIDELISVEVYPNPVTTQLNVKTGNIEKGTYTLNAYDLNGKQVFNTTLTITSTGQQTSINTTEWAAGIYHIQLSKGGIKKTIAVMKK